MTKGSNLSAIHCDLLLHLHHLSQKIDKVSALTLHNFHRTVREFTPETDASTIGHEIYIVFLEETLSLISKLLKKPVYSNDQLLLVFEMYNVCLSCFETFSSHEDNTFKFREARTRWKKYEDVKLKGLSLLASHLVWQLFKNQWKLMSVDNGSTYQVMFATHMSTCACILDEDFAKSDGETTLFQCEKTVLEFERLSIDDQPFGRSVCNSVISQLDQCTHGQKLLNCVLGALDNQCKIGKKNLHLQFLKFVEECVIRRRGAVATVAKFLNIEADRFQKFSNNLFAVQITADMFDLVVLFYGNVIESYWLYK
ncbi:hypothetical protein L1887_23850 [Cichorium endivia]|nr:hypothetical protein L1887_23850 [Cichorium endivia]